MQNASSGRGAHVLDPEVAVIAELRVLTYGQAAIEHARKQVADARQHISECLAGITHESEAAWPY